MDDYNINYLLNAIRIIYEYNCEQFDAELVQSRFGELILGKDGCMFLPDGYTRSVSMENARKWIRWVDKVLYRLQINKQYYRDVTKDIERLGYDDLRREYENIPKEMIDEIEKLGGVKL